MAIRYSPPKRSYKPSMSLKQRKTPQIGLNIGFDVRTGKQIGVFSASGELLGGLVTSEGQPIVTS